MRFIFLTMDGNHGAALRQAAQLLQHDQDIKLQISLYTAPSLHSGDDWQRLRQDVAQADFVFGAMLFGEELVRPLQEILAAASCPVCVITSNPALIYCTRLGKFELHQSDPNAGGLMQWVRKLRPKRSGHGEGQRQLAMLRNLGRIMQHIPGKARDLHTYIAVHDYWMHPSPANLQQMLCMLVERYVPGYAKRILYAPATRFPDAALYHPAMPEPVADLATYARWRTGGRKKTQFLGSVGILSLRTPLVSGNTAHLDALVRAIETRGIEARVAYSANLDFRPAIEQFFKHQEPASQPSKKTPQALSPVDLLVNAAGFSLVGGMAESHPDQAQVALGALDVGYLDLIPLAFQRVEDWQHDDTGLSPIQLAMNVAIPELDSAAEPLVYGGPTADSDTFVPLHNQIEHAADRIARRVALHCTPNASKRLAVILFNFPPNLGNAGTAAYLDVFQSLHRLLGELKAKGYQVELPADPQALRRQVVEGNAERYGTDGNVGAQLPVADYRRLFPAYRQIEPCWGYAPGELLTDGACFHILGQHFGNVFVGMQPSFGYERDPMRLLMAKDAAPHHGFAAFYTWLDQIFGAHAVVHFGTHGALEFMPGKQAGLSTDCWPSRLLGSLPNFYYYSVNNPSEATIAKRRGAATVVSYMVPPLQQAGLYKGLRLLKDSLDSYRQHQSPQLLDDIRLQAEKLSITAQQSGGEDHEVAALAHELLLVEQRMIPLGLHVLGATPQQAELVDMLALVAAFVRPNTPKHGVTLQPLPQLVAAGLGHDYEVLRANLKHDRAAQTVWEQIDMIVKQAILLFVQNSTQHSAPNDAVVAGAQADAYLRHAAHIALGTMQPLWTLLDDLLARMLDEQEVYGLLHALEGGYTAPSPSNDVVRNQAVVPTGRNIHGLDPFRVPTAAAQETGTRLVDELLEHLTHEQGRLPETVALVLWGTDNLKSDGEGVAQVLALLGARPVLDELGKVSDVALLPLSELNRPRIDVVVTVSGIFRDLLHHQMALLDKAARLAAAADEPCERNYVRKHALAQAADLQIGLDEAATRIFSNAPGSYGANVNHLVESSTWEDDAQLAEAFVGRKSFAYGAHGQWREARAIMEQALQTVDATFQNIDSFELGISDVDHYYEYLGGITKSVERLRGERPPVLVADALATTGGRLSSLEQMVRLESRAKLLNPKWYEAMLSHGYEGVREIETRVSNTFGWSVTTNAVDGWVYQGVADTFVLDDAMRRRLADLNPHASAAMTRRLLEANARGFWNADLETLEQLQAIYGDLEDQLEGVAIEA